jgi:hypothetical protein
MKYMKFGKMIQVAVFSAAVVLVASGTAAFAGPIAVSYLAAGVQNPSAFTNFYETFDGSFNGTTNFNGSTITGTYSGNYSINGEDQYGGAGGTGNYISAGNGASYTLTLSQGVNYFGYWLSALDDGNQVQIYSGNTLLFTFEPSDLIDALGVCSSAGGYCGNPNADQLGNNSGQLYAYTNFYDAKGTFNKIVFTETCCGGYESDNHSVANLNDAPGGTPLDGPPPAVPEPSSLILLGTGVLGVAGGLRRKMFAR